jgi:hypothetical protein
MALMKTSIFLKNFSTKVKNKKIIDENAEMTWFSLLLA